MVFVTPVECMGGVTFPPIGELPLPTDPARPWLLLVSAPGLRGEEHDR